MKKKLAGHSLIELLLVLLILCTLSAIAYPILTQHLLKLHRQDALISLTQEQLLLEQCYRKNHSYQKKCPFVAIYPHNSIQGYYLIKITNLQEHTYRLNATPIKNQQQDSLCTKISINQNNQKNAQDFQGKKQMMCWKFI